MSEAEAARIVNWNVQWRRPRSRDADILRDRIWAASPDIVCLTEADREFLSGGHVIEAEADYGYPIKQGRRKVLLWSKRPWSSVDQLGHPELPSGRFVQGQTETPLGPITVVGVCIPWRAAHCTSGRRDRAPWEDHLAYVDGLSRLLPAAPSRLVVVGDFNQKIPRTVAPAGVSGALTAALQNLHVATKGKMEPLGVQLIDHIAHSRDLSASAAGAISNLCDDRQLTDHVGVALSLQALA